MMKKSSVGLTKRPGGTSRRRKPTTERLKEEGGVEKEFDNSILMVTGHNTAMTLGTTLAPMEGERHHHHHPQGHLLRRTVVSCEAKKEQSDSPKKKKCNELLCVLYTSELFRNMMS